MGFIATAIAEIELTGTEKQAQWGKSIRAQRVAFFEKLGNRAVLREIKPLLVEAEIRVINAYTPKRIAWVATYTVVMALRSADARFWIDSREQDPMKWLRPAFSELLIHYLSHPMFPHE